MEGLVQLYHEEIPSFLQALADTPPMLRLRDVGMNCGCEYTRFPRFIKIGPYSRYEHSLGVAVIVWHFTGSMEQSVSGLFHDIATPAFAHVVDFLDGDHLRQEATEVGTEACIAGSPEICRLLAQYGLTVEQVENYHRYPIADNDAPALSADRLEYTLGNLCNYGFAGHEQLREFYEDLMVGRDEQGRSELVFRTPEIAANFARAALRNSRVYVADEDRFAMQALSDILRDAIERGVLKRQDLWKTEPEVIQKLKMDPICAAAWKRFCGYSYLIRGSEPGEEYWVRVNAKKRWLDPIAWKRGRVSSWDTAFREEMEMFRNQDFSYWLSGAP